MKNRTYGIEIECACKLDRQELACRINNAFAAHGIEHVCSATYYQHNTDGTNETRWEVQSDSSIRTTPNYQNQVEVVSPVLRGTDGLAALKIVCDVVNRYGKINSSCGLHVHHGMKSWDEVEKVAAAFSQFQDTIYKGLPPSRATGQYSRKWYETSLHNQIDQASNDRYTGLNLCSYTLRKTIEFRCAGGSTEYEKISNWVLFTQGLVEAAITHADNARTSSDIHSLTTFVATYTLDEFDTHRQTPHLTSGKLVRTIAALVEAGCYTRDQLEELAKLRTGCTKGSVYKYVAAIKNPKRNYLRTKVVVENGIYKFAETSGSVDTDYQQAATWFQSRYNHFQNAA